jgi:predicted nuclease of predicted toxin-antitoxin system
VRLLADENVPLPSVETLRASGHDVVAIGEESAGAGDPAVLARARAEGRLLVTFDRDFGELIFNQGAPVPPGVLFLRFLPTHPTEPAEVLALLLARPEVPLAGMFTVVDRDRVRQRPLSASRPAG